MRLARTGIFEVVDGWRSACGEQKARVDVGGDGFKVRKQQGGWNRYGRWCQWLVPGDEAVQGPRLASSRWGGEWRREELVRC